MKTNTTSNSQTSLPKMLNLIGKSDIFSQQHEKLAKNTTGTNNYSLVEIFFLQTQYITKCLKTRNSCINILKQKILE